MRKVLTFVVAIWSVTMAYSQTADEILAKYFANTGGVDKWKAVKTMKMEGTMAIQGFEFPGSITSKAPNKIRVDVNIQGMKLVQAYDGKTAWWINPFASGDEPQPMPEEAAEQLLSQDFESPFLDYAAKGHQVAYDGTAEVEGAPTHVLKLTKKSGEVEYHYFDAENFVPIMSKSQIKSGPAKGQFAFTYMSDYQEVSGLMFPFFTETKMDGQSVQKMTFKTIKINEDYKDDLFDYPVKGKK